MSAQVLYALSPLQQTSLHQRSQRQSIGCLIACVQTFKEAYAKFPEGCSFCRTASIVLRLKDFRTLSQYQPVSDHIGICRVRQSMGGHPCS